MNSQSLGLGNPIMNMNSPKSQNSSVFNLNTAVGIHLFIPSSAWQPTEQRTMAAARQGITINYHHCTNCS